MHTLSLHDALPICHFQVKAYGGKSENRWVDIFPTRNKNDITRISWAKLKSDWTSGWLRLPKDQV